MTSLELTRRNVEFTRTLEREASRPERYAANYADVAEGSEAWRALEAPRGAGYAWDAASTYIAEAPWFAGFEPGASRRRPPSPAPGRWPCWATRSPPTTSRRPATSTPTSPAGRWLTGHGVAEADFNSYGARRGHHEVMVRGTFANVRLRNLLAPGSEGGVTVHQPSGERLSIFDAAERYAAAKVPLLVFAGQEYGTGSSRDWAAKGTRLLGVRAVVARSFERIHRANLVGMGVLPFQLPDGLDPASLKLDGTEQFDLPGVEGALRPRQPMTLRILRASGAVDEVALTLRIDTPVEVEYFRHGGILPYVLRQLVG